MLVNKRRRNSFNAYVTEMKMRADADGWVVKI